MDRNIPTDLVQAIITRSKAIQDGLVAFAQGGERRSYPWRKQDCTPYEVLVAELLLKRTTATIASRTYADILSRFPTPPALKDAELNDVAAILAPLGLNWQRARSMKAMALHLLEHEDGKVPNDLQRLLRVPGLGDYGARAVLSFSYGVPAAIVDSNVERVLRRVFYTSMPEKPNLRLYQAMADTLLPQDRHREFNFGMLDLGALVCRPVAPLHQQCPLSKVCDYYRTVQEEPGVQIEGRFAALSPLRKARQGKGLTLVQLAALSKVTKRTILSIEHGRSSPSEKTLEKLAAVLGVTPSDLK
jgi:A/G-specific adenine glycosylase